MPLPMAVVESLFHRKPKPKGQWRYQEEKTQPCQHVLHRQNSTCHPILVWVSRYIIPDEKLPSGPP